MFGHYTGKKILSQIANTHARVSEVTYISTTDRGGRLEMAVTIYDD